MIRSIRWTSAARTAALVVFLSLPLASCADAVDALTAHARPVAAVGGESLSVDELATMMADSPLPDSALTGHWAAQLGRLWADYVSLARVYQSPDSTASLDYDALLEGARYYSALAVERYRDSVVLAGIEPTDEEVRAWFDETQPLTRLDVRRIRVEIPPDAAEAVRDSLAGVARRLHDRVTGGADFIEVARSASDEPPAARGQVLSYQGHGDFPAAADSVLFTLRPGEISPVVATDEAFVFYRVERRRAPEFEAVADIVKRQLTEERRASRLASTSDSLLAGARRVVADGAESVARTVATSDDMAEGRISPSLRLVRYEGGELTVGELRELFRTRLDLRRQFQKADPGEIGTLLYQIAGDDILIQAATSSGAAAPEAERANLKAGIGRQLAAIARRMGLSHALVANPVYDLSVESRRFLKNVLDKSAPVPWATEFRMVLDQRFPSRVDEHSAAGAAERARRQRGIEDGRAAAGAESDEGHATNEADRDEGEGQ